MAGLCNTEPPPAQPSWQVSRQPHCLATGGRTEPQTSPCPGASRPQPGRGAVFGDVRASVQTVGRRAGRRRFLWLPSDPRVTVSRGPAGPGGTARGAPCTSARALGQALLRVRGGREARSSQRPCRDSCVKRRWGSQGPGPSPSLSTAGQACAGAPSLPGPREPVVSWAQLSKVWGPQRVAWRQAHCPKDQSGWKHERQDATAWGRRQPDPTRGTARWGARPGSSAGQAATKEPVWEEGSPGQAAGAAPSGNRGVRRPHPTAWTDRRTQPHSSGASAQHLSQGQIQPIHPRTASQG